MLETKSTVGETKEILQKQLELLSEYSKNSARSASELADLTKAMVAISELLLPGRGLSVAQ